MPLHKLALLISNYLAEYQMTTAKEKGFARHQKHRDKLFATREGHIQYLYAALKWRTKKKEIALDVTVEDLVSIAPDNCPVFGIPLTWCQRNGKIQMNSPSLDRIDPQKGYVKGNVQWISHMANAMKYKANPQQLHQFADWIKSAVPLT